MNAYKVPRGATHCIAGSFLRRHNGMWERWSSGMWSATGEWMTDLLDEVLDNSHDIADDTKESPA